MKEFKVLVHFYQGGTEKVLYECLYLIMEESKEKAGAYVNNFLVMQNFYNFEIVSTEEVKND